MKLSLSTAPVISPIQGGIPMSTNLRGRGVKYPFTEMKIGESFSVSHPDPKFLKRLHYRARNAAFQHGNLHGCLFSIRSIDDNTFRIWRIQ